jgi:phospholipid/cholesterol/gamma-HCH transport system substrate-binding protein
MAVSRSWKELVPGLVASATLLGVLAAILLFARVGAIRGDSFTLFVRVAEARGVMQGSEVWLAGQNVGRVEDVQLLPPGEFAESRVLIRLTIRERHRNAIRSDSEVRIGTGGQIIGNPGVALTIGTPAGQVVASGDTVVARERTEIEDVASRGTEGLGELPHILADVRQIASRVKSGEGSAGAIIANRGTLFEPTNRRLGELTGRFSGAQGGLVAAMRDAETRRRLASVLAGVDSVRSLLSSSETSLGRFRRDTTLFANLAAIQAELDHVRALVANSEGTAGRIVNDGALLKAIESVQQEMAALFADAKARPLRYISF